MVNMRSLDQILAVFAPFECLNCHKEGGLLCHQCGLSTITRPPARCYACLRATAGALCPVCAAKTSLGSAWVATKYKGLSVQLIGRLKFARTQAAAPLIAKLMDERLPACPVGTVVVHVPTAPRRIRQRGYDQAQLIARELARCRQLPCYPLLKRQGNSRQLGANRQERHQQLQTAYYCPFPRRVAGRRILLIDDVITTGATVEAAAKVLMTAGATQVSAAAFAQKI